MAFSSTEEREAPRITPAVQWLIAINVAVYFAQITLLWGRNELWSALAFQVGDLTTRPWTIVTYMFVHAGFWHLAVNMWMLWLFGPRVEDAWSPRQFTFYYLLCGLGGWLFDLMLNPGGYLVGASAAIYGVMLAYAVRWPDEEIRLFPLVFISLKVKWLVVLLVGFNLAMGVMSAHTGVAYFAHLGGFVVGWLYLRAAASPGIDRLRQRVSPLPDVPDEPPRAIPRSHPRSRERTHEADDVVAQSNALSARPRPVLPPPLRRKDGQPRPDELDLVLDKISQRGIGSLTRDERRLLEEMSRRLRNG